MAANVDGEPSSNGFWSGSGVGGEFPEGSVAALGLLFDEAREGLQDGGGAVPGELVRVAPPLVEVAADEDSVVSTWQRLHVGYVLGPLGRVEQVLLDVRYVEGRHGDF